VVECVCMIYAGDILKSRFPTPEFIDCVEGALCFNFVLCSEFLLVCLYLCACVRVYVYVYVYVVWCGV